MGLKEGPARTSANRLWCVRLHGLMVVTALASISAGGCSKDLSVDASTTNNSYNTINETVQVVGPAGARVGPSPGGAYVDIPPGALTVDTEIKISELEEPSQLPLPEKVVARSPVFAFEPHGTTFAIPVSIVFPHSAGNDPTLALYRADPGRGWQPVEMSERSATLVQRSTSVFCFYASVVDASGADGGTGGSAGQGGAGGAAGQGGSGGTGGAGGAGGSSVDAGAGGSGGVEDAGADGAIQDSGGSLDASCASMGFPCNPSSDNCCSPNTCQFVVSEYKCAAP